MKIPKSFQLLGQTIRVVFRPEKFTEHDGNTGFASYRLNEIQLCPSTETHPLTDKQIEQVFWHELTHFVLYHSGAAYSGKEDYMHKEEGFVDLVGSLLHQAVTTFNYSEV